VLEPVVTTPRALVAPELSEEPVSGDAGHTRRTEGRANSPEPSVTATREVREL
jgi:hypothetical protein